MDFKKIIGKKVFIVEGIHTKIIETTINSIDSDKRGAFITVNPNPEMTAHEMFINQFRQSSVFETLGEAKEAKLKLLLEEKEKIDMEINKLKKGK